MTSKELFKTAASGQKTYRPPLWIMRQAGRFLPEYRVLKQKHTFVEIVKNPELAVEAALQPMRRFDFDCSILFSDILVVSEALGFPYSFADKGGLVLQKKITCASDIETVRRNRPALRENLKYVAQTLKILRSELPDKAILGFCGSPFTIGAYMVEGGSSKDFSQYLSFIKNCPNLFKSLMDELTAAITDYAQMQTEYGIDGLQIFDSHAALAEVGKYAELSGQNIAKIAAALKGKTRTIFFANQMSQRLDEISKVDADIVSLDSSVKLSKALASLGAKCAMQGNLDPAMLSEAKAEDVAKAAVEIIEDMHNIGGHIFNLGHGIRPDAKLENVEALCQTVKEYKGK